MKKYLLLSILLINFLITNAQFGELGIEQVNKLIKTKTYVVLSDSNQVFNNYIKDAVSKSWKHTKIEFINFSELKKYSSSETNSFIIVLKYSVYTSTTSGGVNVPSTTAGATYSVSSSVDNTFYNRPPKTLDNYYIGATGDEATNVITLQLGGKNFNNLGNFIGYVYGGIGGVGFSSPKIYSYIEILNNTVKFIQSTKCTKLKYSEVEKNSQTKTIDTDKTLIFWKGDIPIGSLQGKLDKTYWDKENISKEFNYKFKIVDSKEYQELWESKDSKYLYYGTFVDGFYTNLQLYDSNGEFYFIGKLGATIAGDNTWWFKPVLKRLNKAYEK